MKHNSEKAFFKFKDLDVMEIECTFIHSLIPGCSGIRISRGLVKDIVGVTKPEYIVYQGQTFENINGDDCGCDIEYPLK